MVSYVKKINGNYVISNTKTGAQAFTYRALRSCTIQLYLRMQTHTHARSCRRTLLGFFSLLKKQNKTQSSISGRIRLTPYRSLSSRIYCFFLSIIKNMADVGGGGGTAGKYRGYTFSRWRLGNIFCLMAARQMLPCVWKWKHVFVRTHSGGTIINRARVIEYAVLCLNITI